jgi:hypothetical protein
MSKRWGRGEWGAWGAVHRPCDTSLAASCTRGLMALQHHAVRLGFASGLMADAGSLGCVCTVGNTGNTKIMMGGASHRRAAAVTEDTASCDSLLPPLPRSARVSIAALRVPAGTYPTACE